MIPVLYPDGRAGNPRARPARLRDVALLGLLRRLQGRSPRRSTRSASVIVDPAARSIVLPEDFEMPAGRPQHPLARSRRWSRSAPAARQDLRGARLSRAPMPQPHHASIRRNPRLGIIASGKSVSRRAAGARRPRHRRAHAAEIGIRLYKVGMTWPLESDGVREFAEGLDEILVVEEKRQVIEYQLKEQLYNWRDDVRPRVVGKYDEHGEWECTARRLAAARRGRADARDDRARDRAAHRRVLHRRRSSRRASSSSTSKEARARDARATRSRAFRTSARAARTTRRRSVPEGSRALAGIGCHYMAIWIRPEQTTTFTQMGGEGATWIGHPPFTDDEAHLREPRRRHVLPLGLARDARRGGGQGQHHLQDPLQRRGRDDGRPAGRRPAHRAADHRQVAAEGVKTVVVVTDEPEKYPASADFAAGVTIRHRDELDAVQRELREIDGHHRSPSTTRPARPRSAAAGSAARSPIRRSASSSTSSCAKAAATAAGSPTASRSCRSKRNSAASARSTSRSCNKDYSCVEGLLPELRHRRWRNAAQARRAWRRKSTRGAARAAAAARSIARTASSSPASAAPAS